jgi:hypothetical protein
MQLQAPLLHSLSLALQSSRSFPLLLSQQIQSFCKLTCFGSNPSDPSDPFFVKIVFLVNLLLASCFLFWTLLLVFELLFDGLLLLLELLFG